MSLIQGLELTLKIEQLTLNVQGQDKSLEAPGAARYALSERIEALPLVDAIATLSKLS